MNELLIVLSIVLVITDIVMLILLHKKRRCLGKLVIDMTNPEKDVYRIEMDDLQDLEKEKFVLLKVRIEDNAQK